MRHSSRRCSNWAGRSGRTSRSSTAGPPVMTRPLADSRPSSPRSRPRSSSPPAARLRGRCCKSPALCRSYSRSCPTRSAPDSSTAWRGRGATRLVSLTAGIGQWGAIQTAAPSLGLEVSPLNVRDAAEIERAIMAFARSSNGGLIVTGSALSNIHRKLIITLAAHYRLPAVYFERFFVTAGGLISYGPDFLDQYRRAAVYVDRILRGEKPAELPVQAPTKYVLAINLKTAKALGLDVPPTLLARADEVIE